MDKPERHGLSHPQKPDLNGWRSGSDFETGLDLAATPRTGRDRITIALIEDNRLVREGLTMLLNRSPDLRVIGGEPEGRESMLRELDPDVVVLNLGLANGDSLQLAREVLRDLPRARIIVMNLLAAFEDITDFVTAGVSGFVMKDASMEDVVGTIRAVAAGLKVLPDKMTTRFFSEIMREPVTNQGPEYQDSPGLTPREREVLDLIAEGMSNKAIGKELRISIHTVKSHLRNIMEKLALNSRLELATYIHTRSSVVRPGPVSAGIERLPSTSRRLRTGQRRTGWSSRRSAGLV